VLRYTIKRLFGALPTLLIIVTMAFFMIRLTPGGPFDTERPVPAEIQANLNKVYHLDEPLIQQYGRYLWNIVRGDFGPSFQYKDFTVTELIWKGFPVSIQLGFVAILLAFLIGTTFGALAALRQNSWIDYTVMGTAMTGITIPNFVIAPVLTLVFGIYLKWLPVGGWGGGDFKHTFLPIVSLALPQIAYISRLTRGSMIEVLRSNFIRTARAKGLPEYLIVFRHSFRAALLPVISYLGPAAAHIVTGSVVIETIFGIPGIGRYFVQGALNRDYTLVMGVVIFFGALIILFNLLVDLIYGLLDPRVRYD
jgi:oligopeptide transport system permease protein